MLTVKVFQRSGLAFGAAVEAEVAVTLLDAAAKPTASDRPIRWNQAGSNAFDVNAHPKA